MENTITPDRLYFKKHLIGLSLITIIIYIPALLFGILTKEYFLVLLASGGWGSFVILYIILIKLWIKNLQYIIKDNSITVYKGILTKIEKNIPNEKVTDFVLERDLIDRFLGIASIKIQTAGQSTSATGYEAVLSGILDYTKIHQDLKQKLTHNSKAENNTVQNVVSSQSDSAILTEILNEIKKINHSLKGD